MQLNRLFAAILLICALPAAWADAQGFTATPTLEREYQINDSEALAAKIRARDPRLSITLEIAWADFLRVHDYVYTSEAQKWRSVSQHAHGRLQELRMAQQGEVVATDEKAIMISKSFNRLVSLRRSALALLDQAPPSLSAKMGRCIQNLLFGSPRRADHE